MDYESLIKILHILASELENAASAIETLLAERKAMLEDLRSMALGCDNCKHKLLGEYEYPCCECGRVGGEYDHWQWHGTSEA